MTQTKEPIPAHIGNQVLDVLTAGDLNWRVEKLPLISPEGYGQNESFGLYTSDNKAWLGTVGKQYLPVQNFELVETVCMAVDRLGLKGDITATHLGTMKVRTQDGKKTIVRRVACPKRVYIQIALEDGMVGKDDLKRYLSVLDHKDGKGSIAVGTTNVVVICQNTFNKAFRDLSKIYHTTSAMDRVEAAMRAIEGSIQAEDGVLNTFKTMTEVPYNDTDFNALTKALFGVDNTTVKMSTRKSNQLSDWNELTNRNLRIHGKNRWGLFNAVTDWTNHVMTVKADGEKKYDVLDYVTAGTGERMNSKAFDLLSVMS